MPVSIELRLHQSSSLSLTHDHPLFDSVPAKILQRALWLTGHFHVQQVGDEEDHFLPKFDFHPTSGLLISQEEFVMDPNIKKDPISPIQVDVKAAKEDDARVPVELWDNRLVNTHPIPNHINKRSNFSISKSLEILRKFSLLRWKQNIRKSFISYLKSQWPEDYQLFLNGNRNSNLNPEFIKDLEAGRECISYVMQCSWWEWNGGS
jgi:hypothetical protein